MKKKTIGSYVYDLLQKEPETRDPIELEREMQREYLEELISCVQRSKKDFKGDFFVVVLTKNERVFRNRVLRNIFFPRHSCPTPNYDQSVFKYNSADECLEYIWTIPSQDSCHHLLNNKHLVVKEEQELLRFVLDFADGTLMKRCMELNNEGDYGRQICS
jgi:hypothetical protein